MVLSAEHLCKLYGKKQALKDFTYTFEPGVYGLLGPNGAGKSTLIRLLTTCIEPNQGMILFDGEPVRTLGSRYRRQIGFMPQYQALYENFTLERYLDYICALKEVHGKAARTEICRAAEAVGLTPHLGERLKGLSGGMRQRTMLAQALIGDPRILILDEPSAGLDPKERNRLRALIAGLSEGKIVLLATHIVSDIELIAGQILILDQGSIRCSGSPEEVCSRIRGKVYQEACQVNEVLQPRKHGTMETGLSRQADGTCLRRFISEGTVQTGWMPVEPNLEDLYLFYFCDTEDTGGLDG